MKLLFTFNLTFWDVEKFIAFKFRALSCIDTKLLSNNLKSYCKMYLFDELCVRILYDFGIFIGFTGKNGTGSTYPTELVRHNAQRECKLDHAFTPK